ncbi:MAG TPA: VWA domain-containing protein [Thermoanaerobaculia bacterium]|nr:VWA domain-containing protein [Thermoanaerobaculia bacterium]
MNRPILPAAVHLAIALLGAVAVAAPAWGQRFGEEISIVEIEIPVQVLRGGDPVAGLTAGDFEVFDDGEPREIVSFRVVDLTPAGSVIGGAEAGAGGQAVTAVEREGRTLLVLFDFLFSRPHYLERSLAGIREMVTGQLHSADRVGIAYLTGSGAQLALGFTGDRGEIDTALDAVGAILDRRPREARELLAALAPGASAAGDRETEAEASRSDVARLTDRFGAAAAVTMLGGAGVTGDDSAFSVAFDPGAAALAAGSSDPSMDPSLDQVGYTEPEQLGASLAAAGRTSAIRTLGLEIGRLATLLRDVPGQRQLLYLSEGFSSNVLNNFASGDRALVLRYLETMFEALRRGGWTLHAIDVGGVPDPFSRGGFDADALHYMANETGGQLYENFNRVQEATALLVARTSLTYVLTIRPGELPSDGRLHRLEVRLTEPGGIRTRLLHRSGYYAPKPASRKNPLERQMDTVDLLLGERQIDGLGARLLAGSLPPAGGLVPVPVVIEVPGRPLLGDRDTGRLELEIQLFAVDEREGVQDLWLRTLQLDLGAVGDTVARGGLRILAGLALPPGDYRLRALVSDPATGRVSLTTSPYTVTADGGGLLPLAPVVIDRSGDWLELVALPSGPGGAPAEALAFGPTFVVPPVSPQVVEWQGLEFLVVTPAGEELELSGRLLDSEGRPVAPPEAVVFVDRLASRNGTLLRHLGRAATAELPPGSYRLEVSASAPAGASRATRSLDFEVRADG